MAFTLIAVGLYGIIALGAMALTLAEFLTSRESTFGYFLLGLVACAAWPLTIAVLGVVMAFRPAPIHPTGGLQAA